MELTTLLVAARRGQKDAFDRLVPLVYASLRRLAASALRRERPGHTLTPTALAHEAYMKLAGLRGLEWRDRAHFFGVAAGAMRRILVNHAEGRRAAKRGYGASPVSLDEVAVSVPEASLDDVVAIDAALQRLRLVSPRAVRVVECRVFMGMSIDETADALELSPATVKRQWTTARAWLTRELGATRG